MQNNASAPIPIPERKMLQRTDSTAYAFNGEPKTRQHSPEEGSCTEEEAIVDYEDSCEEEEDDGRLKRLVSSRYLDPTSIAEEAKASYAAATLARNQWMKQNQVTAFDLVGLNDSDLRSQAKLIQVTAGPIADRVTNNVDWFRVLVDLVNSLKIKPRQ